MFLQMFWLLTWFQTMLAVVAKCLVVVVANDADSKTVAGLQIFSW